MPNANSNSWIQSLLSKTRIPFVRFTMLLALLFALTALVPTWLGLYGHDSKVMSQSWVLLGGIMSGFLIALVQYGLNRQKQRARLFQQEIHLISEFRSECRHRPDLVQEWDENFESCFGDQPNRWKAGTNSFADPIIPIWLLLLILATFKFGYRPRASIVFIISVLVLFVRELHIAFDELRSQMEWEAHRVGRIRSECVDRPQFLKIWKKFEAEAEKILCEVHVYQKEGYWRAFGDVSDN